MRQYRQYDAKPRYISALAIVPNRGPHPTELGIAKVFIKSEGTSVTSCRIPIESKQRLDP